MSPAERAVIILHPRLVLAFEGLLKHAATVRQPRQGHTLALAGRPPCGG